MAPYIKVIKIGLISRHSFGLGGVTRDNKFPKFLRFPDKAIKIRRYSPRKVLLHSHPENLRFFS